MKILVVDDEELIRNVIKEYAISNNMDVLEAENGEIALNIVKDNLDIDCIVLDIMMPKMDGYTFFKELKNIKNIPTIVVSARSDEYDKLQGFDLGIDDYMTKPFSPRELMARIKVITKRNNVDNDYYEYKNLKLDYKAHILLLNGEEVKITLKEYELLCYFIDNKNTAISRDLLLNKIWGYDFYGDDRTIDTHIKMLRQNLGDYRDNIETVRGVGYRYVEK